MTGFSVDVDGGSDDAKRGGRTGGAYGDGPSARTLLDLVVKGIYLAAFVCGSPERSNA